MTQERTRAQQPEPLQILPAHRLVHSHFCNTSETISFVQQQLHNLNARFVFGERASVTLTPEERDGIGVTIIFLENLLELAAQQLKVE